MVLVHGGAGSDRPKPSQLTCLSEALILGFNLIQTGQTALDVVESMIKHLEESGLFNAGLGSRRQLDGAQRMDAAIMEGRTLKAGAVASLTNIRYPISAARIVMEQTNHVLLVGSHATRLARHFRLEHSLKTRKSTRAPKVKIKKASHQKTVGLFKAMAQHETVGAVALDAFGRIAAGASTGGVPMMLPGRVGDTPLIGSGVYADNESGAISMTGLGEGIIRLAMANRIALALKSGKSPALAVNQALTDLKRRVKGSAGTLVLAPDGKFAIRHTTPWMSAGYWDGRGRPVVSDQFRRERKRKNTRR